MTASLYMDHNVVRAVADGCRDMGLEVITAFEDGWHERSDVEILERAGSLGCVVFTQDTDFLVLAKERQSLGVSFPSIVFGKHGSMSVRKVIDDLVMVCQLLTTEEQKNQLIWLPL